MRRDSKAGSLAPRHGRDSRGLRLTSVPATRKVTNHECNQERRAGAAVDAGDRSEGGWLGPGDVHTVGRNVSTTKPAKFIVILLKKKGVDVVLPAE